MLEFGSDIYPWQVDISETSDSESGDPSVPAANSRDMGGGQSEQDQLENNHRRDIQEDLPEGDEAQASRQSEPDQLEKNQRSDIQGSDAQERALPSLRDDAPPQQAACEVDLRCLACDRIGCNPDDPEQVPLCAYFGKTRGEVPWSASDSALQDTALGDNVRHFAEATVQRVATGAFLINGEQYLLGTCPGEGNNCLIHALQQCCSAASWSPRKDVAGVRLALQNAFPVGKPHEVREANFLTLDAHWRELLRSMLDIDIEQVDATFRIWCLDLRLGSADFGDAEGTGSTVLRLARTGRSHFVPLVHRPDLDSASLIQKGTNKTGMHGQPASALVRGRDHSYWDYESATDVPLVVEGASSYVRIFARGWLPRDMYEKVYASSMKMTVPTSLHEDMKRFKENVLLLHDEWNPNLHDCLRQIRQARLQTCADDFAILNEAQVQECLWAWAQQYVFHEGDLLKTTKKQRVLLKKAIGKEIGCQDRLRAIIKRGLADMLCGNEQELAGNFFHLIGEIEREAASMKRERTQRRHRRASSKAACANALERASPDAGSNGAVNHEQNINRAKATGKAKASGKAKKGQKCGGDALERAPPDAGPYGAASQEQAGSTKASDSTTTFRKAKKGQKWSSDALEEGASSPEHGSKRKASKKNEAPEEDYYD